ncbi:unnamed protein product, partial [Meganyctiphanes norvegica]
MKPSSVCVWQSDSYYNPQATTPYAMMILNESLSKRNLKINRHLWQNACVRICIDGGTNLFHDLMRESHVNQNGVSNNLHCESPCSLPHLIVGDLDSARPELLKYYGHLGVEIVHTPDQDETDFTKAVRELKKYINKNDIHIKHVVVSTGIRSDRFDHVMANIASLYKADELLSIPLVVLSSYSLYWLLSSGSHEIHVSNHIRQSPLRSWCALIPMGHPVTTTTTGLKWNLKDQALSFGELVSTSNTYDNSNSASGIVTVQCSHPLLWIMGWE